ncbi:S-locus lectin protein kinase family protein [Striga asiatica]|uniref:S-locus lectin protein kinase family protein n=1 Tax=Striga asiatica TaxID=4170 RepID=A0A5A7PRA8_STRAF|nr:S-locus lectin protein kinase family protein [Striga asiatica]
MSTQQYNPPLLFVHSKPISLKPATNKSHDSRILFLFSFKNSRVNLLSESIGPRILWVRVESDENRVNFLDAAKTFSLYEYITPTLKPGMQISLERPYTMWTLSLSASSESTISAMLTNFEEIVKRVPTKQVSDGVGWVGEENPTDLLTPFSGLVESLLEGRTRKAFPWSARQNVSISSAGVAPQVNITREGSKDTVLPITSVMKSAIACNSRVSYTENSEDSLDTCTSWTQSL